MVDLADSFFEGFKIIHENNSEGSLFHRTIVAG